MMNTASICKADVLIIGAGCFGISTALHLKGQKPDLDVLLIEKNGFPSELSASNCTSRGIRSDYTDSLYVDLGLEALRAWREDPVFKPFYYETGRICASMPGNDIAIRTAQTLKAKGVCSTVDLAKGEIASRYPGLSGEINQWDSYLNREAGWADAAGGLKAAMTTFLSLGGRLLTNHHVVEILGRNVDGSVGIRTAQNEVYLASKIILATGAYTSRLVNTKDQLHAVAWAVAHWRLTSEEMQIWKNHPVVDIPHVGYFFPPNKDGLMKMGTGMVSFLNSGEGDGLSRPGDDNRFPAVAEDLIRGILRQCAPVLSDKTLFGTKICWDSVTMDMDWLIAEHPELPSVFIAAGGSGHAFKFLPILGKYVVQTIDGTASREIRQRWAWRQGTKEVMKGREKQELKGLLRTPSRIAVPKL